MVIDLPMVCQVQEASRMDKDGMTMVVVVAVDSYQECQSPAVMAAHPKF